MSVCSIVDYDPLDRSIPVIQIYSGSVTLNNNDQCRYSATLFSNAVLTISLLSQVHNDNTQTPLHAFRRIFRRPSSASIKSVASHSTLDIASRSHRRESQSSRMEPSSTDSYSVEVVSATVADPSSPTITLSVRISSTAQQSQLLMCPVLSTASASLPRFTSAATQRQRNSPQPHEKTASEADQASSTRWVEALRYVMTVRSRLASAKIIQDASLVRDKSNDSQFSMRTLLQQEEQRNDAEEKLRRKYARLKERFDRAVRDMYHVDEVHEIIEKADRATAAEAEKVAKLKEENTSLKKQLHSIKRESEVRDSEHAEYTSIQLRHAELSIRYDELRLNNLILNANLEKESTGRKRLSRLAESQQRELFELRRSLVEMESNFVGSFRDALEEIEQSTLESDISDRNGEDLRLRIRLLAKAGIEKIDTAGYDSSNEGDTTEAPEPELFQNRRRVMSAKALIQRSSKMANRASDFVKRHISQTSN
ncbi:hypothetical protein BJ742DRAFT_855970 [Cladochytrium replicatum]|nr:hypothetical protein BJ742DRAFT_855970 [Cladochytrium replicatum]